MNLFAFFLLQIAMVSSDLEVPVFYPTYEEFKDFSAFISSIEARGVHRIGLAKIVPPKEWLARHMGYKQKEIDEKMVENPIKQEVHGKDGAYSVFNIQQRSIKLNSFQRLASSNRYAAPRPISNDFEKLEKKYWQSLTSNAPIYGAGTF
jgi:jumonji domain-containing protein 2